MYFFRPFGQKKLAATDNTVAVGVIQIFPKDNGDKSERNGRERKNTIRDIKERTRFRFRKKLKR